MFGIFSVFQLQRAGLFVVRRHGIEYEQIGKNRRREWYRTKCFVVKLFSYKLNFVAVSFAVLI